MECMEALKRVNRFYIDYRTAVDPFGRDCILPLYDGVNVFSSNEDGEDEYLGCMLWDSNAQDCYLRVRSGLDPVKHIRSYDEFKDFCEVLKLAKYHIGLAHRSIVTSRD